MAVRPNQTWLINFIADKLVDGRSFSSLNILYDFNREVREIEFELSLQAIRVVRSLKEIIEWYGKPVSIRVDNEPEYGSELLIEWTEKPWKYLRIYLARKTFSKTHT